MRRVRSTFERAVELHVNFQTGMERKSASTDSFVETLKFACDGVPPIWETLLASVVESVQFHVTQRTVADWPFENFWHNPSEPDHSRMLGYFLDPKADRGYLLSNFIQALVNSEALPDGVVSRAKDCLVSVEKGRIDLCIECRHRGHEFALIIENKINSAANQPQQLQRYVEKIHERGFRYGKIYVLFLALNHRQKPADEDIAAIQKRGVWYRAITFQSHILPWLLEVTAQQRRLTSPPSIKKGMLENLEHYRNLISFLLNSQRTAHLNMEILMRIKQAEKEGLLPAWQDVSSVHEGVTALKRNMEGVLRGRFLLKVQSILKRKGIGSCFYVEEEQYRDPQDMKNPFDERFQKEVNLCIETKDMVYICFGGAEEEFAGHIFWSGYMPSNRRSGTKSVGNVVLREAEQYLQDTSRRNAPWFAWNWNLEITYTNCTEDSMISQIADGLAEMYRSLDSQLATIPREK